MADLTITAGNVVAGANAKIEQGFSGGTLAGGKAVYKDTADASKFKLGDCDDASATVRTLYGVALNGASAGQPVAIQTEGDITIGGTVVVGEIYVLSDTAGGIMPEGDLETGDYVAVLGVGISTTQIRMGILNSGVAVP